MQLQAEISGAGFMGEGFPTFMVSPSTNWYVILSKFYKIMAAYWDMIGIDFCLGEREWLIYSLLNCHIVIIQL